MGISLILNTYNLFNKKAVHMERKNCLMDCITNGLLMSEIKPHPSGCG